MKEPENNSMDDEIVSIESQTEEKTEPAAEDADSDRGVQAGGPRSVQGQGPDIP